LPIDAISHAILTFELVVSVVRLLSGSKTQYGCRWEEGQIIRFIGWMRQKPGRGRVRFGSPRQTDTWLSWWVTQPRERQRWIRYASQIRRCSTRGGDVNSAWA